MWACRVGGCLNVAVSFKMEGVARIRDTRCSWKAHTICRLDFASRKLEPMIITCLREKYQTLAILRSQSLVQNQQFITQKHVLYIAKSCKFHHCSTFHTGKKNPGVDYNF